LVNLTKTLSQEFGPYSSMSMQSPRPVATGRLTTPEEVATLITFLASDRAANITGANYLIDSGLIKTT
jgi:NAD(P)-dependent dehydrogenase (short-subunit alcohol dehydrogenase family)